MSVIYNARILADILFFKSVICNATHLIWCMLSFQLTWADLQAINVLSFLVGKDPEPVKQHQKLYAHYTRIIGLPRIAEYLQKRPKYDF